MSNETPNIEFKKLSELTPDPENANEGSERGRVVLNDSMEEYGFLTPGVVDKDGTVLIGNKRAETAKSLGMDDAIIIDSDGTKPIYVRRTDLDLDSEDPAEAARARGSAYYDNWAAFTGVRINAAQVEADYENPILAIKLDGMMTQRERVKLGVQLDKPDTLDELELPPEPSKAQQVYNVELGDIWKLGRHTLYCGDSTDADMLLSLSLSSALPTLLVTSPPYGVGKDYEEGGIEEWRSLLRRSFETWSEVGLNTLAINLGDKHTGNEGWELHTFGELLAFAAEYGYQHLNTRVWTKQPAWSQTPYWRSSYKTVDEFEYIAVLAKEKPKYVQRLTDVENNEWGYRSVWQINSVQSNDIHTAMFPIELPMRLIRIHTNEDDVVFEPFAGSGTTLIACEAMRRSCIAVELLPEYCAVTLQRFAQITGEEPERMVKIKA